MNASSSGLDPAFIRRQHQRLVELRAQLRRATRAVEAEEGGLNAQSQNEAHEFEDDAQKLAMLEVEGTLVAHDLRRLALVERALSKIEDGTYGLSDVSGRPIAKERLEATPEAIDAVEDTVKK
jgi:DnaK suppressor protein